MTRLVYRGDSPEVLVGALIVVLEHARSTQDDFRFGPLNFSALNRDGLEIWGDDLSRVIKVLRDVPGLALVEESADSIY